jgi:hypothetical protein
VLVGCIWSYDHVVARLLRFVLRVLLFFLALATVVAIGAPETGPIEKAVLIPVLVGFVALTIAVSRIGSTSQRSSQVT